jgi:hypothetical protein
MLTPFRWLTLTHAVQHPLAAPDMTNVTVARKLGSTYAEFRGPIANHAQSTGRLDVRAEWTEDVDLLTEDSPRMQALGTAVPHAADAFGFDIEWSEDQAEVTKPGRDSRHEFGDTKYRRIVYHSIATTRFREYLPRPIADDAAAIQRVEPTSDAGGPKLQLVRYVPSTRGRRRPTWCTCSRRSSGRRRTAKAAARASRQRGAGLAAAAVVLLRRRRAARGRATAGRAAAARVGAHRHHAASLRGRARHAAAVVQPVPLRRATLAASPAAVRRAGDQVQAVAASELDNRIVVGASIGALGPPPPSAEELRRMLTPYVTDWGSDPVWQSRLPERRPRSPTSRGTSGARAASLDSCRAQRRVVIAAHEVFWSPERKLWYCDIEI